ncbi:hypothetical protein [Paenibacillus sp. TC-CSREp1]|uniref:hypothetical protein n=1 Tax=Paenibacillus sp. TC-CSREp1 TaxID=3410089 RepID=UPI003CF2C3A8
MLERKKVRVYSNNAWFLILLTGLLTILSACCNIEDASDEMNREHSKSQAEQNSDVINVEVLVESDLDSVVDLKVEIDARKHPQSVYSESVEVPYRESFVVPKDTFIPLTSTHVEAGIQEGASWISCSILYDGELVVTHKSRGKGAKALCEKNFRLGPG